LLARVFGLRGDFVPDARLLDYLVALLSTDQSAALDGTMNNRTRLKRDLADLGVFDERMSFYMLFRPREHAQAGYSGFEGRYYSLFANLVDDMTHATNLQTLITALAYKYMIHGQLTHAHVPDTRYAESERRQIFFGCAIGLPHFYVRKDNGNAFLSEILRLCDKVRPSGRYRGYLKVGTDDYRRALMRLLRRDAADLIEAQGMEETLRDLEARIDFAAQCSAHAKLTNAVLDTLHARSPMQVRADEFNAAAERYYRGDLKAAHLTQALELVATDMAALDRGEELDEAPRRAVRYVLGGQSAAEFFAGVREAALKDTLPLRELQKLIGLILITIHLDGERAGVAPQTGSDTHAASVR
jgi:hypothetical protein